MQITRKHWKSVQYMSISDPHIAVVTVEGIYVWNRITDEEIHLADNTFTNQPVFSRETTKDGKQKVLLCMFNSSSNL
jgi:hypothetical protein